MPGTDLCKAVAKEKAHHEHKTPPAAFLVGGYVRDLLIQQTPKDADIEVFGIEPTRLQTILEELFPHQIHDVGRAFGILKVHLSHGIEFDVAIPRTESKIAAGHKGFAVNTNPYLSQAEAARRRDFTVNAISLNPLTGEVIDPWNGQVDLKNHVLRVVDPQTFVEDPLRVYRAIQFIARLEFTLDPTSRLLMEQMVKDGHLKELSPERITDEWAKLLLLANKPSVGFELMRELGIIKNDYPELQALIGTQQEPEWHPEGDVWIHTMLVTDQAAKIIRREEQAEFTREEKLQTIFGALCHDLGKPPTTFRVEKKGVLRWTSPGHQEAGEAPTLALCARLRFSESVVHAARMITLHHLRPSEYYLKKEKGELTDTSYANAVRTLLKKTKPLRWQVLHASAEADFRGRGFADADTRDYPYGELFKETILREKLDEEALHPLVMGHELIELFQLEPGPYIGDLMRTVEHARDQGTITTKEEALLLVEDLIKNRGHQQS
jgi:tRNA nucleotidyltransferase (CCA-adding enzyme)